MGWGQIIGPGLCRSLIIGGGPKTDLTKGDRGTGPGPAAARAQSGQGRYLSDKLGPGPPALHGQCST